MASIQAVLQEALKKPGQDAQIPVAFYSLHSLDEVIAMVMTQEPSRRQTHVLSLSSILSRSPADWRQEYIRQFDSPPNRKRCAENLTLLLKVAHVPALKDSEHHYFDASDFQGSSDVAMSIMSFLEVLLSVAFSESVKGIHFISSTIADIMIILLQHIDNNLWTSPDCVKKSNEILSKIQHHFQVSGNHTMLQMDCEHFILDCKHPDFNHEATILNKVLKSVCCELTKEKWKQNPGLVWVFSTVLIWTKFPYFSFYLIQFLPASLLFIDDYVLDNKLLGIRCLHHIIRNTSNEELRWYGRAEVIYEALKHQLYTHKVKMIQVLHPAMLDVLKVVEAVPACDFSGKQNAVNRYDEVYQMIVVDADGEQNIGLRKAFTKHLPDFVDVLGITVIKHLQITMSLIKNYLEVNDGSKDSARINILRLLEKIILTAWSRMQNHEDAILKMLIKLLIDIAMDESDSICITLKEQLVTRATQCLILLKFTNESSVCKSLEMLKNTALPCSVHATIDKVIAAEHNLFDE